jgi:microcompartment protein CcmL/EutN
MNNEPYDYAAAMDQYLDPVSITKNASDNAVQEALESLNKAAEILDAMGCYGDAEVITKIMEHLPYVVHKAEQTPVNVEFIKEASAEEQTQQQLNDEMLAALLGPR